MALPPGRVHLWLLALDAQAGTVSRLNECLPQEERDRAARFRHPDDRRRWVVARGALRWLIGRYLGRDPATLRFEQGRHGKPALAGDAPPIDLQFNLSHSAGVGLAGFCIGRAVGVDLEHADRSVDARALATRICSPQEQAMLARLPEDEGTLRFIELWTCKEAWMKAVGLGISAGPAGVDVDLSPDGPRLVGLPLASERVQDWSLALLRPADDLIAALAVADSGGALGDPSGPETVAVAPGLDGARIVFDLTPGEPPAVSPPRSREPDTRCPPCT
jgi:4'-phosphopantetheinyl transferase